MGNERFIALRRWICGVLSHSATFPLSSTCPRPQEVSQNGLFFKWQRRRSVVLGAVWGQGDKEVSRTMILVESAMVWMRWAIVSVVHAAKTRRMTRYVTRNSNLSTPAHTKHRLI